MAPMELEGTDPADHSTGDAATARLLPARDVASVQLAEHFGPPGCPVCRHRAQAVDRYIEGFLYESVNDVAFRHALDATRGFCPRHVRQVFAVDRRMSGGMLGSAILFEALMRVRQQELEAVHAARGISRRRRAQAATRPAACMACSTRATVDAVTSGSLVRLAAEPAWADALAIAELCLEHLAALMAVADRPPGWKAVEERQLARLGTLRDLVRAYGYHSSHDRRHLMTPQELEAPSRAAAFLSGGDR